ncbi:hypothetical protein PV326_013797, partial [Microctonus aethiopoides]
ENIFRQRMDNVATSMNNEGRSGAAEKRNETDAGEINILHEDAMERANNCLLRGAKLCAGILEEVAKATLWSKLSSRRHSGYGCRGEDSDLYRCVEITLYATP